MLRGKLVLSTSGYSVKSLVLIESSDQKSENAVSHGLKLAQELKATVTFVTVTELWSTLGMPSEPYTGLINPAESYEEILVNWVDKVLANAANKAENLGIDCETNREKDHLR